MAVTDSCHHLKETDVLIVGGGPVGLALAGDLGWRGVDCLLVEQSDGIIRTPKMNEVNVRTMEFCRRWGIDDAVMNCPFPDDYPMDIAFVTALGGFELARMKRPAKKDQVSGPKSPVQLQICSQLWFDPILREFASGFSGVEFRHRHRFEGFEETPDGITARITDLADDSITTVSAKYLVGCDGAASGLRSTLGIGLEGPGVLGHPVHFYFRAPTLLDDLGVPPTTFFLVFDGEGAWANIRIVDPVNALWRLMVLDTSPDFDLNTVDREAYLRRAVGHDYAVEWVGVNLWERRGLVAERYNAGRVFLAGDAVHQLSPTGALGMNTGIGDAVDLGWKLAAVLDGWGGAALLRSYDAERRPIGMRNVLRATEFHGGHLDFQDYADIAEATPEAEERRQQLGQELIEKVGLMFRTEGLQIGYAYQGSPICIDDGTAPPPDEIEVCHPNARPGSRAPHAWMGDGRSTLDVYGKGFVLLNLGGGNAASFIDAAASVNLPLEVVAQDDPDLRALHGAAYVLVRPDGHVAWRGDDIPDDPTGIIDVARGAG
ncbi:MAG: FAD-dependent monooxygenase [Proteobacteria bacterium]|nr:FAD-dependent monooxygenase [Pseudomonadota bacterium]